MAYGNSNFSTVSGEDKWWALVAFLMFKFTPYLAVFFES